MNITKQSIDGLNILIKVEIQEEDYAPKVEKLLKDYTKTASIPGFRKGHVPLGMVRKKYGNSAKLEEINKLIQTSLGKYLSDEKVEYLGHPIPSQNSRLELDKNPINFEFELGLKPSLQVNLNTKKAINRYEITLDGTEIDDQLISLRKRFGKITSIESPSQDSHQIKGTLKSETMNVDKPVILEWDSLSKQTKDALEDKKTGDAADLDIKKILEDKDKIPNLIGVDKKQFKNLKGKVSLKVEEVNNIELAELNQDFFDKIYGKDVVKSEKELREKISQMFTERFASQSDQHFLDAVTERLLEETKIDLPEAFLKRWLSHSKETPLDTQQAEQEFKNSEKGLRYQLLESKILDDNQIRPDAESLKDFVRKHVVQQMNQFGRSEIPDDELSNIVNRVLSNEEESKNLYSQLLSQKLLDLYKEKVNQKIKKVNFETFVKETKKI